MKELIKTLDDLPWIIKMILALPVLDGFVWGVYRMLKGIDKNDGILILSGIIWIFAGLAILWIIDLVTIFMYNKVTVLA
ncbi:MAG: hypothetical protein KKG64_03250 [Firmicutes bacterium]|nr:hypothetical protein [Bacillota bacterium]